MRESMKEKIVAVVKQKTTWFGVAAIAASALGLPIGSVEQIVSLIVGVVGVVYPEKPKETK